MKPPTDITPSELWKKLEEWPAPSEVVDFPRKYKTGEPVGKVRIFVLDGERIDRCRVRAIEAFKKLPRTEQGDSESIVGREIVADLIAREVLAESCHEAEPYNDDPNKPKYKRIFMTAEQVGKLYRDEPVALFASYLYVQEKFGPHESNLSKEEVDGWIRRLVEGGSALPLAQLASPQLVDLTQWLAIRVYALSADLSLHSQSLPSSLAVTLEEFGCATSSSGELPSDSATNTGITIEQAMSAAKALMQRAAAG